MSRKDSGGSETVICPKRWRDWRRREIRSDGIDEVKDKVAKLPLRSGMSVRTALVYAGDLSPAVEESDYFDFVVPIQRMFGMG